MNIIQNIDNILLRDGTSQNDRNSDALRTDYVAIEGRSLEELIAETQRLAKELQFFDEQNRPTGTWESFLIDDPNIFNQNSLEGRKIQQKHWAKELAAYVENPELFYNNAEKKAKLSKPHVVLFITFLKLLNHLKSKMNGLTEKHLDFYYRKYLQLEPKQAVPDVVNVLLELEENTEYLEVQKGTILQAGEDVEGNELQYVTNEDTVISKAQITQLKSVFVSKDLLTIRSIHQERGKTKDATFVDMVEMALGHPNPGDALPEFPETLQIESIFQLNEAVQNENAEAIAYIGEKLFLERDEFDRIFLKHQQDKTDTRIDWEPEYQLLEKAYKRKSIHQRQQSLKEVHFTNGFDALVRKVYGNPNPGDSLPLYNGEIASLEKVLEDLQASDDSAEKALEYVEVELLLRKQDFIHIMQTETSSTASEEDKNKAYRILEFSERQLRAVVIPVPETEQLSDIYDTANVKDFLFSQYEEEAESKRFKTFGNRLSAIEDHSLKPSEIGFAISSPTLLLKDGKRTIEVLLDLNLSNQKIKDLQAVFDKNDPFQTYLSSEEQWFTPDQIHYSLGDFAGIASETDLNIEIKDQSITRLDTTNFSAEDVGDYIVDATQKIYEIIAFNDVKIVEVKEVGVIETPVANVQKYKKDQVYLNALKIKIQLQDNDLPITTFPSSSSFVASDYPVMVCTLKSSIEAQDDQNQVRSSYQHLVDVALQKSHIRVDVHDMQQTIVENDQGSIDTNKPFEPFGFQPEIGTSFYIANDEISQKRLQDIQLHLEWMKPPTSFVDYYKNYWLIQADHTEEELAALNEEQLAELIDQKLGFGAAIIENDHDFNADVFLHDRNAQLVLSTKIEDEQGNEILKGFPLFNQDNRILIDNVPTRIKDTNPDYQYKERFGIQTDEEEALRWDRYFRVELTPINFQHSVFNTLSVKQAMSEKAGIKKLKINPPYQPKLKKLGVSYTSCDTILANKAADSGTNKLFHIHPFGYDDITIGAESTLIPMYRDEGSLYLGIAEVNTPQVLSILFQMAEGSADPAVEKPELQWSYLRNNEWIALAPSNLLQDGTNGLLNTGILKIRIPEDATKGGTLMPSHLHWIKISAFKKIEGVSDTIDIRSQVISATLASETVALTHFENPLPVDTITEELNQIPEVARITQPFTSSKGKPVEKGDALYKRISERLRHKNRALTMWDYEHMILHQFPEIYKTKCLPASDRIGGVNVIVVPDIKGKLPFNPFAPKVAADTLLKINSYIENLAPTYAEISISNPKYLQVSTECVVKFYPGYDEVFYRDKLIEEIKRFMSPWAYGEDNDIQIGGALHASVIINFIAERPYIDYVANLKLFQSEDGKTFTDVRSLNNGKSIVTPSQPDMIMVAAQLHEVYVVNENGFEEDSFEGINYMEINKDFVVR